MNRRFAILSQVVFLAVSICLSPCSWGGEPIAPTDPAPGFQLPFPQDFAYSKTILDWQENVTGKPLRILEFQQAGAFDESWLLISGAFWGSYMAEYTDTDGKFAILSRFPDERGNVTNSAHRWVVNNAAIGLTARPVPFIRIAQVSDADVTTDSLIGGGKIQF